MKLGFNEIKIQFKSRKGLLNFSWMMMDFSVNIGIAVLTSAFINRYLGAERYGILSYCIALCGLWEFIIDLGSKAIVQKEVVLGKYSIGEMRGTGIVLNAIGATIGFAGVIITLIIVGDDKQTIICSIILALGFFFKISCSIQNIFIAKLQADLYIKWNVRIRILLALLRLLLVFLNGNLYMFVICYGLEPLLLMIVLEVLAWKHLKIDGIKISIAALKDVMSQSWAFILSNISVVIYMRIDQVMIGRMIDATTLGKYSAAVTLTDFFSFIPISFSNIMLPILTENYKNDKEKYREAYVRYFEWMIGGMSLIALIILLFGKLGIWLMFGEEYYEAIYPLRVYALTEVVIGIGIACGAFLNLSNNLIKKMKVTSMAAIANIILNAFLIPRIGMMGAACATLVSQFIGCIGGYALWESTRELIRMVGESLLFRFTRRDVCNIIGRLFSKS